ncbi:MAG: lipoyl(octanoyl) transferase LipB [Actinomycetota bacterium]
MTDLAIEHPGDAPRLIPYTEGWSQQREFHADVVAGRRPNTLVILEHEAVYTAGKRTARTDRPTNGDTPVVDVDRGGRITWHGPGQLVGYPILRLPDPIDVVAYVRLIEEVLISACASLGLSTHRVPGRSGVWVPSKHQGPDRKVAAIGIRVARSVTMHGFALNCDCDLSWADQIVPCGIDDAEVTSLSQELSRRVSVAEATPIVIRCFQDSWSAYIEGAQRL